MGEVGFDVKINGETCKIFLFFVKLSKYFGTFIDYFELPFSGLHLELSDPLTNTVPKVGAPPKTVSLLVVRLICSLFVVFVMHFGVGR